MEENLVRNGISEAERKEKKASEGVRIKKRFVFTAKDKKALKWICEQGVGTVEQLWWVAWKGEGSQSSKYAEERLREMAQGGYLKRERVFGSHTTNYIITQKGRSFVEELYPERKIFFPPVPRRVNDGQYRHTMALNWCRAYLEQDLEVKKWMSDRAMQSWLKRNRGSFEERDFIQDLKSISPDACFYYQGELWLFEYEGTQKNKDKYEKKAKDLRWMASRVIEGVIFVAASPGLESVLKKHYNSSKCVIFTFEELKCGMVNGFLKGRFEEKIQREKQMEREREEYYERKRQEKETKLPELQIQLKERESELGEKRKYLQGTQDSLQDAYRNLDRFNSGFIKLPGQREKLEERVIRLRDNLRTIESEEKVLLKEISELKREIGVIEKY